VAVVAADVRTIAPELRDVAAVPEDEITAAIADAVLELSAAQWGTMIDVATKWMAAHKLAVSHPELCQPAGTKIRVYETPGAQEAGQLGSTRFGVEFVRLRRTMGFGLQVL
jgi:hypothetical protein